MVHLPSLPGAENYFTGEGACRSSLHVAGNYELQITDGKEPINS
jgi:hypothetical protein